MKKSLCLLALLAMLYAAPAPAQQMGTFTLETADGEVLSIGDYLGDKVVLMTFFTTWCKPCMKEHPHLQDFWEDYEDDGLMVIAISSDEPGSISEVRAWIRRYKLTFPVLLDSDFAVTRQYDPDESFPLTMLIGRDGVIHHIYQGYNAGDEAEMEDDLLELLGLQ